MKRIFFLPLIFIVLAACSIPPGLFGPTSTPTEDPNLVKVPTVVTSAQSILASELGISPESLRIVLFEPVIWENSCLDLPLVSEICKPEIINGYQVELQTGADVYLVHTGADDSQIRWIKEINNPSQAALTARQLLAGLLGYDPSGIRIVSEESRLFTDSCLEIYTAEVVCAQVKVRGSIIHLQAGSWEFEFRNREGIVSPILAEAAGISASRPAITWSRTGGPTNYCDDLLVYLSGLAVQYTCKGTGAQTPGIINLTPDQQRQILLWIIGYQPFEFTQTLPDGTSIWMISAGAGVEDAQYTDRTVIEKFVADLLQTPGTPSPASK